MNYDAALQSIIDALKADKSFPPEYRNAVVSSGRRWQCEIRGLRTMTNRPAPEDLPIVQGGCNCPPGGKRRSCLVHGEPV